MSYIDLSCPAEIFRSALPTEEIPAATLTLFNLSDRVIVSAEVSLRLLDGNGDLTEQLAFRGRALNGRPHSTFLLTVPCAPSAGLKTIEASIEKVWFADNEVWRRDPRNTVEYTPNALPVSPALTRLKYAAGETAVGWPSRQNGLWVCVCGRPNREDEPCCVRCGRQMETVFSSFSPESVDAQISMKERQLDLSSRNMREDTIRLQRIREEEYNRKKERRKTRLRVAAAAVFSLLLTAGALFFGAPWLRLAAGRRALETGDAAGAKATFEALGSFGNADKLIGECDWIMAKGAAQNSTTPAEMAEASRMLRALHDRPEAVKIANETDMLLSRYLLGNGDWQGALEALEAVPADFDGRSELGQECRAAQAYALQEAGQYDEARIIWQSLTDRPGAWEQAAQCVYIPAKALMDSREWDSAIEMLSDIPDYMDSRELTLECHYHKAEELMDAGDIDGASREFLLAGDWSDAPEQCRKLTYQQAEALYSAGDLKAAQPLYASIPDYLDANEKDRACRYALAKEAADSLEYSLALELLRDVPDDYKDTASLRTEAAYQKARSAVRQEDWATAADLLGNLDREALGRKYRDIETLYLEACEKAGIEAYPATPEPSSVPETTPAPDTEPTASPLDSFRVTDEDEQP